MRGASGVNNGRRRRLERASSQPHCGQCRRTNLQVRAGTSACAHKGQALAAALPRRSSEQQRCRTSTRRCVRAIDMRASWPVAAKCACHTPCSTMVADAQGRAVPIGWRRLLRRVWAARVGNEELQAHADWSARLSESSAARVAAPSQPTPSERQGADRAGSQLRRSGRSCCANSQGAGRRATLNVAETAPRVTGEAFGARVRTHAATTRTAVARPTTAARRRAMRSAR